jgi:hypothetical protein
MSLLRMLWLGLVAFCGICVMATFGLPGWSAGGLVYGAGGVVCLVGGTWLLNRLQTFILEKRMRPGAWSRGGFLGPNESLKQVISQDARTLARLGVSRKRIAKLLERLLNSARKCTKDMSPYPNLYEPETIPHFTLDNLPQTSSGYLDGDFQVFTRGYCGFQTCPWECEGPSPQWSSFDFLILNRQTGEYVTGPGLAVHLIRCHRFFEGPESPYRTDPKKLIDVLKLVSRVANV